MNFRVAGGRRKQMRLIDADALKKEIFYEHVDGIMSPENYCVMHNKLVNAPNAELWHDMGTDTPTMSSAYLIDFNRIVSLCYYDSKENKWYDDHGGEIKPEHIHHWMKIPELPEVHE